MNKEKRIEILRLKAKQSGKLMISFLLDGKKMELENLEFEKRFGDLNEYKREKKGVDFDGRKEQKTSKR